MGKAYISILCILALISVNINADNKQTEGIIDSLKTELTNTTDDSTKVRIYVRLAFNDRENDLEYLNKGLDIAKRIKNNHGISLCYQNIGAHYLEKRMVAEAMENFHEALKYSEDIPYTRCRLLSTIAGVYLAEENMELAKEYANKALDIAQKNEIADAKAHVLFMLARIAHYEKEYDKAEKYYLTVLDVLDKENKTYINNSEYRSEILFSLGANSQNMRDVLKYYTELYDLWKDDKSHHYFGIANICLADSYITIARSDSLKKEMGWNKTTTTIVEEARNYLMAAKLVFENINDPRNKMVVYQNLAEVDELLGDYKSAHMYNKQYHVLNDSIFSQENKNRLAASEKKNEIDKLTSENERKEEVLQLNRKIYVFIAVLLIFFLIAVYLYYKNRRYKETTLLQQVQQQKDKDTALALLQGQETERQRIARDLHDGLGSLLSSIKYSLQGEQSFDHIKKVNSVLDSSIDELRRISHDLTPIALSRYGLIEAIKEICQSERNSLPNMIFEKDDVVENLNLSYILQINIYRIILEAINNARKYADATNIFIQILSQENNLFITVEDDGVGFELNEEVMSKGIGLKNIRDRVNYLGGKLRIDTKKGEGTSIYIELEI